MSILLKVFSIQITLRSTRICSAYLGVAGWYFIIFFFILRLWLLRNPNKFPMCRKVGNGTPLHYCCPENPMDGGAWSAAVHGVAKGRTRLSDFIFTFHFHALEKEMAAHSSVLAWRTPGTGEPGGLPSLGSHRVGHDWSDIAAAAAWRGTSYFSAYNRWI